MQVVGSLDLGPRLGQTQAQEGTEILYFLFNENGSSNAFVEHHVFSMRGLGDEWCKMMEKNEGFYKYKVVPGVSVWCDWFIVAEHD